MRILVLTNMYPGPGELSWRGVFVKDQIDEISSLHDDIEIHVMHILGGGSKGGSNLNYLTGLYKFHQKLKENQYDLIWAHHSFCVFLAIFRRRLPLIYTAHEGFDFRSFRSVLVGLAIKISNHALIVNKSLFGSVRSGDKYFIPCGVDTEKFCVHNQEDCRKRLHLKPEKYYIFFPAEPKRPEKNVGFLEKFSVEYSAWLEAEGIEIVYGGDISHSDMPYWMNAVNCMLSFSYFESDGMVFKEAMACDLPVITFNVGNAEIYFAKEIAGSIISRSTSELKEKISYWRKQGRSNGREQLMSLGMNSHSVANKIVGIFKKLIQNRAG